jgi:protein-tyrosine phosphatase
LGFVDIHSHILHSTDDGARDMDESIAIAEKAWKDGVRAIVATPHYTYDMRPSYLDGIEARFAELKEALKARGIQIGFSLGAEVALEMGLPQAVKKEKRITLGGSGRFILVEMPFSGIPDYAEGVVFELLANNIVPVWAHPERCPDVIDDYKAVKPFVDNGMLLQINAGSLLGSYGRSSMKTANRLIEAGIAHIVASDTHRLSGNPVMAEAHSIIQRLSGPARAQEMGEACPARVAGC